jgi:hypothetical protein
VEHFLLYIAALKARYEKGLQLDPSDIDKLTPTLCHDYIQDQILTRLADSGGNFQNCEAPIDELMASLSGVVDTGNPNKEEFVYLDAVPNGFKKVVS